MQYRTGRSKTPFKHPFVTVGSILLILIIVVAFMQLTGTMHLFSKPVQQVASGSAGATKGEPQSTTQSKTPAAPNSPTASSDKSASTSTTFSGTLLAPSGDFVSSHHVSSNTQISSVCTTTPGATCKVTFRNGNTTKSLAEEMSDANGSVYWNAWTPASLGLSAGSWQIEAYAYGGQQTKSSIDALSLEVAP